MSVSHAGSKRSKTGAKMPKIRDKQRHQLGNIPLECTIGTPKMKTMRCKGGGAKENLVLIEFANVMDPKTKKISKSKVITVKENTANRHYVRRNVITKGAVIQTELGMAKVTSRPGQHGILNAILV